MGFLASRMAVSLGIGLVMMAAPGFPQVYPAKPIRLVVPGPPASATDLRARWLSPRLGAALGQSIVVDNRPGAGGNIATEMGAKSVPDGYTLLLVHQGTLALNPHIYPRLGYDPLGSFAPVTRLGMTPLVLAVHPGVPAHSVTDLIRLMKQRPGQFNYGSAGIGTPPHLAAELFSRMAKIQVTHVPYKGGAPALIDLIAGRIVYTFDNAVVQMPNARAGKVRALAVTSAKRAPGLPDVRTIAESGLPGYDYWGWQGIAAPSGTPQEIVVRLNAAIVKIMATPEAREWFAELGGDPTTDTPREFAAYIKQEYARWGPIIREAGIRVD